MVLVYACNRVETNFAMQCNLLHPLKIKNINFRTVWHGFTPEHKGTISANLTPPTCPLLICTIHIHDGNSTSQGMKPRNLI